jgi:hypothetical protein
VAEELGHRPRLQVNSRKSTGTPKRKKKETEICYASLPLSKNISKTSNEKKTNETIHHATLHKRMNMGRKEGRKEE